MVRRNIRLHYGILAACIASGIAGIVRESQGWWWLCLLLLAASIIFEWVCFRCPFCHEKIHWFYYRPGKCCPHCGAELEDDEE